MSAAAKAGDKKIQVASTEGFSVGDWLMIGESPFRMSETVTSQIPIVFTTPLKMSKGSWLPRPLQTSLEVLKCLLWRKNVRPARLHSRYMLEIVKRLPEHYFILLRFR